MSSEKTDCPLSHGQLAAYWKQTHGFVEDSLAFDDAWMCESCEMVAHESEDHLYCEESGDHYCEDCVNSWRWVCSCCNTRSMDRPDGGWCPDCGKQMKEVEA